MDHQGSDKPTGARRIRLRRPRKTLPGAAPGAGIGLVAPDAPKPQIRICAYNTEFLDVVTTDDAEKINQIKSQFPGRVFWIEIKGFGDKSFLEKVGADFNIHRLELDDVVNTYQRPKLEESPEHLFIVSRTINGGNDSGSHEEEAHDDQLSVFLGKDFVLTFQ